jgi:hypothetical protein
MVEEGEGGREQVLFLVYVLGRFAGMDGRAWEAGRKENEEEGELAWVL